MRSSLKLKWPPLKRLETSDNLCRALSQNEPPSGDVLTQATNRKMVDARYVPRGKTIQLAMNDVGVGASLSPSSLLDRLDIAHNA